MTLSELCSICSTSVPIGADHTVASVVAPRGARPRVTGRSGRPSSRASSRPAARSGWALRCTSSGAARPPSVITAVIARRVAAGDVLGRPERRDRRTGEQAVVDDDAADRSGVDVLGQVGQPGRAGIGRLRSLGRAAERRVAAADQHERAGAAAPDGRRDPVGRRRRRCRTAAAVRILAVEAGAAGTLGPIAVQLPAVAVQSSDVGPQPGAEPGRVHERSESLRDRAAWPARGQSSRGTRATAGPWQRRGRPGGAGRDLAGGAGAGPRSARATK